MVAGRAFPKRSVALAVLEEGFATPDLLAARALLDAG